MSTLYLTFLLKDFRIEFRSGQSLIPQITLTLLFSIIGYFALSSTFLEGEIVSRFVPGILWLISIIAISITTERTLLSENSDRAIDWILLSGVSCQSLFLSKATINLLISLISHAISILIFFAFFQIPFPAELIIVSFLGISGLSLLLTLLSALSVQSRLSTILLPVIALPLLFPLFFAAVELYLSFILEEAVSLYTAPWLWMMVMINILFLALGLILFERAFRA